MQTIKAVLISLYRWLMTAMFSFRFRHLYWFVLILVICVAISRGTGFGVLYALKHPSLKSIIKYGGSPSRVLVCNAGRCFSGDKTQLWDKNGAKSQKWQYDPLKQVVTSGGFCLDVKDGGTTNGTSVRSWDCNKTDAQKWLFQKYSGPGKGAYQLRNPVSGRCLDAAGAVDANGTPMQLWECSSHANGWNVENEELAIAIASYSPTIKQYQQKMIHEIKRVPEIMKTMSKKYAHYTKTFSIQIGLKFLHFWRQSGLTIKSFIIDESKNIREISIQAGNKTLTFMIEENEDINEIAIDVNQVLLKDLENAGRDLATFGYSIFNDLKQELAVSSAYIIPVIK